MANKTKRALRVATAALSAWVALAPVMALAEEEERSGIQLLIPALAELIPATIAFCIIFFIMSKFAWPMVVKMMDDREKKIQSDIDDAAKLRWEANDAREAYYGLLEEADRKADEVLAEAKRKAEIQSADIIAEAQKESAAIIAKAHDVIDADREKAMADLAGSVVDLAVEIASKVIGDTLDEDRQRALAIKYLAEVGSLNED